MSILFNKAKPTRLVWQQTCAYFLAFITLGIVNAAIGPILPDLVYVMDVSLAELSTALAFCSAGYMVGSFVGGLLYDRISGNRLLLVYFGSVIILTMMLSFIPGLWWLTVVMFVLGLALGGIDVGGNTLLVWVHGDAVTSYMNMLHFFYGVGAALAPMVIGQLLKGANGLRGSFRFLALSAIPIAIYLWFTPSPVIRITADGEGNDRPAGVKHRNQVVPIVLFALFFFLYVGAEGGFGRWIATYARAIGVGDATVAANLTAVYWGTLTVGRLLSIPIAAKVRPRWLLVGDLAGTLFSVALTVLFPKVHWLLWVGTAGAGLFMASMFPTMMSMAERHLKITGKITGWFFVGASLGSLVLPWGIGQLFDRIGPVVTVQAILGDVILECVVFAVLIGLLDRRQSLQNEG